MSGGVVAILPAYDAAHSLAAVAAGLRAAVHGIRLVAVNDGSRDDTEAVARRSCDEVISFGSNRGKGAALRAGFERALALEAEAVLTVDTDGQHDPHAAPFLIGGLLTADVVIGARARRGTDMPPHRRITNAISSRAISVCAGQPIPDGQSGYRAIRPAVLRAVSPEGERYEYETAFLIHAARAGFRIGSVPIATLYGAPSHFRLVRDAARVVRTIWRHHPILASRR